ncbi:hypothetical protein [Sinomonas terrae]|uniref:Uncharacterized protein n=1 Tax=Sinomonas terrae TaxID=2908838 RepID=A0ABS9U0U9_9MICC|nr:hypothetical protein [Sinomonas terrae]MCH6470301.1 hypothetical protein [Sinomonas terrae]
MEAVSGPLNPLVDEGTDQNGYLVIPESSETAHYTRSAPLATAQGSTGVAGDAGAIGDLGTEPVDPADVAAMPEDDQLAGRESAARRWQLVPEFDRPSCRAVPAGTAPGLTWSRWASAREHAL